MPIKKNNSERRNAHAKINLCLDIVGRRADGFHLLDTVMQSLELADQLHFCWRDLADIEAGRPHDKPLEQGRRRCFYAELGPFALELDIEEKLYQRIAHAEQNILYKALRLWSQALKPQDLARIEAQLEAANLRQPYLSLRLEKRIPYEAGLGGASADAATLLDFLDETFALNWDRGTRLSLESRIGADVPFTRHKGSVRCRGIGEDLSALPSLPHYPCLIVKPLQIGIKTAAAFARYSEICVQQPQALQRPQTEIFIDALQRQQWSHLQASSGNVFASLIAPEFPALAQWLQYLQEQGSFLSALSGSGSACFALFTEQQAARRCAMELQQKTALAGLAFELWQTRLAY